MNNEETKRLPELHTWRLYTNSRWYWIRAYDADAAYDVAMTIVRSTDHLTTNNRVTGFCIVQEDY